jgi:deoxycytidylate deaminase
MLTVNQIKRWVERVNDAKRAMEERHQKDDPSSPVCKRRVIYCVLLDKGGYFLSSGYNGPASVPCQCPDREVLTGEGAYRVVECYAIHAEERALVNCIDPDRIYYCITTKAPCFSCVMKLLGTPCREIIYVTDSNETRNRHYWVERGRVWARWINPDDHELAEGTESVT